MLAINLTFMGLVLALLLWVFGYLSRGLAELGHKLDEISQQLQALIQRIDNANQRIDDSVCDHSESHKHSTLMESKL